ncbi:MAG: restriction endonuclease subunit S, partial [Clostridia bacterium]|nr:restriction endonuclease subunit S [Clostridia bacterium]
GSVFTNLKTDILRQFEVTMPNSTVLENFQALISPLFETMKNIARENQRLSALRDTLLPKLMSGEIDVSKVKI